MSHDLDGRANATIALHADNPVNVVTDVAPPLHLSTTFRYPNDPEQLTPWVPGAVWPLQIFIEYAHIRYSKNPVI